jgi:head-tail adaptor
VALKQQEINIKAQDLQRKSSMDQGRLGIDQAKLQQTADLTQDKIDSQEDIAQLRANVNLTKQKEIEKSKKDPRKVDVNKNIRFEN